MSGVVVSCCRCRVVMVPVPNRVGEMLVFDSVFGGVYERFRCPVCGRIVSVCRENEETIR